MSLALAVTGFFVGLWVLLQTRNYAAVAGIWYFVAMEFLQFFQFFVLDECSNPVNQWLTVLGFLHICFQPYFTHLFSGAFMSNPKKLHQMTIIRRLCVVMGLYMFSRYLMSTPAHHIKASTNTDWLRGERTCTFRANYHIAWELPLYNPTYFMPSNNIHFFMMFAPYLVMGPEMWLNGIILFTTGPLLSSYITDNLYEQASIWCFFSIGQVLIAVITLYCNLKLGKRDYWSWKAVKAMKEERKAKHVAGQKLLESHGLTTGTANGKKQE